MTENTIEDESEDVPEPPVKVCSWEFDQWSTDHWEELRQGVVDKTKSWIDFFNTQEGQRVELFLNREQKLTITADRDQWGTWITFQIGDAKFTVAQEDGTKSFMGALIAALTQLQGITDLDTKPPEHAVADPPTSGT